MNFSHWMLTKLLGFALTTLLFSCGTSAAPSPSFDINAPDGWRISERRPDDGVMVYTSPDRSASVTIGPADRIKGGDAEELLRQLVGGLTKAGTFKASSKINSRDSGETETAVVYGVGVEPQLGNSKRHSQILMVKTHPQHHAQRFLVSMINKKSIDKQTMAGVGSLVAQANFPPPTKTPRRIDSERGEHQVTSRNDDALRAIRSSSEADNHLQAIMAKAGNGLRTKDIKAVVHHFGEKKYDVISGVFKFNEATFLVLKDGWVYKNPELFPEALDAEASRRLEPERWSKDKFDERVAEGTVMKAQDKGARFNLAVHRPNAHGGAFNSIVTNRGLVLHKNGRFETSMTSLSSSTDGVKETYGSTTKSKKGTFSSTSADSGTLNTVTINKNSQGADFQGQYEIDGFKITLYFDSGRVRTELFATDGERVILGNRYYFQ
ncbi:lipocalin family protein [Thiosocius teredinicola]|uniref:lipocalin family protein n=1 Tax=Thiosocius teredinicola TaxID=1973002 RepID=UPI000990DB90